MLTRGIYWIKVGVFYDVMGYYVVFSRERYDEK